MQDSRKAINIKGKQKATGLSPLPVVFILYIYSLCLLLSFGGFHAVN